ncbi:YqaE/Pmp3 family membrane protein [Shewanella xiamenensis]|nr:YqaE/Pmp3 family membrane protein [Shewanella xiamenensis]MEE1979440.1 YqaE/Pmp3 family membrane protein [Shewanella xiamenensis]
MIAILLPPVVVFLNASVGKDLLIIIVLCLFFGFPPYRCH